jgi:hypothetical protein
MQLHADDRRARSRRLERPANGLQLAEDRQPGERSDWDAIAMSAERYGEVDAPATPPHVQGRGRRELQRS